jgi:hypothetical protein
VSRMADKLARLKAEMAEREQVILIEPPRRYIADENGRPIEGPHVGEPQCIGGTEHSRKAAMDAWKAHQTRDVAPGSTQKRESRRRTAPAPQRS